MGFYRLTFEVEMSAADYKRYCDAEFEAEASKDKPLPAWRLGKDFCRNMHRRIGAKPKLIRWSMTGDARNTHGR
jgi:hypothetical protein